MNHAKRKPYHKIPGTRVFDSEMANKGYHLNQFAMSLLKPENREKFKADEAAYISEWPMSAEQKQAVCDRDYNKMLSLGGNIYFISKIFTTDGLSFQHAAAMMCGMTPDDYKKMMVNGGRSPEGNILSAAELYGDVT